MLRVFLLITLSGIGSMVAKGKEWEDHEFDRQNWDIEFVSEFKPCLDRSFFIFG